jgi:formylglycine-generating enzyme required for sulfatase activity
LKEDIETRIDFLEETTDLETLPDHFSETNLEQREISSRFKMDRKQMGEIANNRRLYIKPFLVMASLMATIIFMMILINNFRTQSFISTPSETTMQIDQSTNEVQITSTIKSSSTVTVTITKTIEPTFAYTSTPMLGIGSEMISEIDRMEMIFVPAGIFVMGSNDGEFDEKPSHEVYLNDYWIDKFEVNHKQFSDFVSRTSYITDAEISGCSYFSSYKCEKNINWRNPSIVSGWINTGPDSPVIHVSWNDAIAYCSWAGRELPTEAQWEKAARGTDKRIYPWGNELPNDELANFNRNNVGITKVTMFMNGISPYGAQNMAGNVWEWVYDRYDSNYYSSQSSWINPIGPSSGSFGIIRGGSWNNGSDDLRSSRRSWLGISYTNSSIGFRCVFNPNE